VPGFEGLYEASTLGRVRSLDRVDAAGRDIKGRVLKPGVLKSGRLQVTLCKDGVNHQMKVHQVIALAFHGPCPEGQETRHWPDRDVTNNRPENLCYGTKRDNFLDSAEHGTHKELRKTHCPRNHPLEAPNLRDRENDWRECLACHHAHALVKTQQHLNFREVADACYDEIVRGIKNPYRRTLSQAAQELVRSGRHYQASKTHCPRGHRLVAPNLDLPSLKVGRRKCASCTKAKNQIASPRWRGMTYDEVADCIYSQLMRGGEIDAEN
jgi:hypothetical protein